MKKKSSGWLTPLLALLTTSALLAQTVPNQQNTPDPQTTTPGEEDVLVLSPFTVSTSDDRGYQAQSSLSGSRLKTNLKDMATPVTAFTEQFLLDTAITNTDDLAKFMVNTNYDLNEETNGQNGQITTMSRPMKMRGLGGGSTTINFFRVGSRNDFFNSERVEQARGPNAILFGVGSPGGLINTTTKRAKLNRNSGMIAGQVRSEDGTRIEADYNQVLLPERLAVRVAAVSSDTNSWRNYAFNDADRLFGAIKLKLSPKAELNVEAEKGSVNRATKRTFTALDAYTPWRDAGSNLSSTANAALGIASLGNNPYMVFNTNTGTLWNYSKQMKTANAASVGGLSRVLTDFSVLPRETSILGPGFEQTEDYTRLSAFFTWAITSDWNLEIAGVREDLGVGFTDTFQGFEQYLYVDPNPTLPNGQPNPNAGRTYLETNPIRVTRDGRTDFVRAITSYRKDLGKWGTHTAAAAAEYGYSETSAVQLREYIVSPNAPNTNLVTSTPNRVFRRTYVDLNGPSGSIVAADPLAASTSGLTEVLSGKTYETAWIPFGAGTQITAFETMSYMAMIQSTFWKNRVHTVIGTSRDERTVFRSTQVRTPLPGFTNGILQTMRGQEGEDDPVATSAAFSGVLHVTPWLGLTYSRAENSALANNTAVNIYTSDGLSRGRFPVARGQSEDVGFKLDLLDHRLFVSALYFETSSARESEFGLKISNEDMNNIWGALNRDGVIDPLTGEIADASVEASGGQTFDQRTQGYELELTANLTPHWRLTLNGSRSTTGRTNIAPEMRAHLAAVRPLWEANQSRALATPSGNLQTIGDMIGEIDRQVTTHYILADGRRPIGQIPHKFNLRTTYEFSADRLKGVSVGGGARYFGRPVIGYVPGVVEADGTTTPFVYYEGSKQFYLDFNIAYRRHLKMFNRNVVWSLQLNVDNVLDNDAFVRLRVSETGALQNYRFNDPREWILSSRFTF